MQRLSLSRDDSACSLFVSTVIAAQAGIQKKKGGGCRHPTLRQKFEADTWLEKG